MSIYNTTNVKDLPQLEEVINGNYLIIENDFGTNIIDFRNFVIGPDNASFYNTILSLSAYSISLSGTVETNFKNLTSVVSTVIQSATAQFAASYPRYFEVYPLDVVISNGTKEGKTYFNSEISDIRLADINIVPLTGLSTPYWAILKRDAYAGTPPSPTAYTYTLTISTNTNVTGNASFAIKVQKYFLYNSLPLGPDPSPTPTTTVTPTITPTTEPTPTPTATIQPTPTPTPTPSSP